MERRTSQRTGHIPAAKSTQVSRQDDFDQEYDDIWPSRMPSSVRRYRGDSQPERRRLTSEVKSITRGDFPVTSPGRRSSSIPARRTATQTNMTALTNTRRKTVDADVIITTRGGDLKRERDRQPVRFHWLFYVGLAMLAMTLAWGGLNALSGWWQVTQDDWHYGRPRTVHVDAVVGHNDSDAHKSHFISLNLNRHIEVIEFPGGDSTKAKIYMGPELLGSGQDLAVPRLDFRDVNGDTKLDMIIEVQDSHFVFINENGSFRALRPGENIHF